MFVQDKPGLRHWVFICWEAVPNDRKGNKVKNKVIETKEEITLNIKSNKTCFIIFPPNLVILHQVPFKNVFEIFYSSLQT